MRDELMKRVTQECDRLRAENTLLHNQLAALSDNVARLAAARQPAVQAFKTPQQIAHELKIPVDMLPDIDLKKLGYTLPEDGKR